MPPVSDHTRKISRRAGLAATAIALLAWCLVVVGALVRAHGAGLACPDWPLCFGEVIPVLDFHVAFEWGHRVMAGSLSIALAGLAAFLLRTRELRRRFLAPIAAILGILGAQIVLGGLTVLLGLAPWTVTAHLLTGNAFVIALIWLSRGLLESAKASPTVRDELPGGLERLAFSCALLLLVQLWLGGLVASHYAGLACTTFPLCNSDSIAPAFTGEVGLQVLHRLNAYALFGAFALFAWRARSSARIARPAALAFGLVLLQVVVGVANVLLNLPIEITALHSALATATAITTAIVIRETLASRAMTRESVGVTARGPRVLGNAR